MRRGKEEKRTIIDEEKTKRDALEYRQEYETINQSIDQ